MKTMWSIINIYYKCAMKHIADLCQIKFDGGLMRIYEENDDAVNWLKNTVRTRNACHSSE